MTRKTKSHDLEHVRSAAIISTIIGIPVGLFTLVVGGDSFGAWDSGQALINATITCIALGLPVALWLIYRLIGDLRSAARTKTRK